MKKNYAKYTKFTSVIGIVISVIFFLSFNIHPVQAVTIEKSITSFPYTEGVDLQTDTEYIYLLNVKPGQLIKANATIGQIYSNDPYTKRTDIVIPRKGHAGSVELSIRTGKGKIYQIGESFITTGSFAIDAAKSKKFKNVWYWKWDQETYPPLNVEHLAKSEVSNPGNLFYLKLGAILPEENHLIVQANLPITLHVTVEKKSGLFIFSKCSLPPWFTRLLRFNCRKQLATTTVVSQPNFGLAANSSNISSKLNVGEIVKSAKNLANLLAKPNYEKLVKSKEPNPNFYKDSYCKFNTDPYDGQISAKAQEVYTWSPNWNPRNYPENYVECVAFVHMVYNMAGIRLPDGLSHPVNWPSKTDTFEVYENGVSSELPKVGDIMIWMNSNGNLYGHVGVAIEVDTNYIYVANANTQKKTHEFKYSENNGKIVIKEVGWQPKYWLRLK